MATAPEKDPPANLDFSLSYGGLHHCRPSQSTLLNHALSTGVFLRNSRSGFVTDKNTLPDACVRIIRTDSFSALGTWDHTDLCSKA